MELDFCDNCKKNLTKEEHYFKVEHEIREYNCNECYDRSNYRYTEHGKYMKLLTFVQILSIKPPFVKPTTISISAAVLLKEIGEDKF